MREPRAHQRPGCLRWGSAWTLCVATVILCAAPRAAAQVVPGSIEDLRARLRQARDCYDAVDYGCVIASLEGTLLVRTELPDGISLVERREGYELLGLSYLAVGFAVEGRRTFERLLELEAGYHLTRPEASPSQLALVEAIRETQRLTAEARAASGRVQQRAWVLAALPRLEPRVYHVWAAMLARSVAHRTRETARGCAPRLASPPWGPLQGPAVAAAGVWRGFFAGDARSWHSGPGVAARLVFSYQPWETGLSYVWTRHGSALRDAVITPAPSLEVHAFSVDLSWVWSWRAVRASAGLEAGLQYLDVVASLRSLNPQVGARAGADIGLTGGLRACASLDFGWTFGYATTAGPRELAASPSLGLSLGLSFAP